MLQDSSFPSSRPFSHASYPTESVSHIHSNLHTHPSIIMHTKPIPMAIFLCSLTPHLAQTDPLSSSFFIPTVTIPTCSTLCTFHHSPCMRGSCTTSRHHSLRLCTHPHQQPMAAAPSGRRQTAATAPLFTAPPRLPSSSKHACCPSLHLLVVRTTSARRLLASPAAITRTSHLDGCTFCLPPNRLHDSSLYLAAGGEGSL